MHQDSTASATGDGVSIRVTNLVDLTTSLCSLRVANLSLDLCDTINAVDSSQCANEAIKHLLIQACAAHDVHHLLASLPNLQSIDLFMPVYPATMNPIVIQELILHGSYTALPVFLNESQIDELILTGESLSSDGIALNNPLIRVVDVTDTPVGVQLRRLSASGDSTLFFSISRALGQTQLEFSRPPH